MAFGGGGSADYQANLILNTDQPERQIQALSGNMSKALRVISRNFNANLGQSLRETSREVNNLKGNIDNLSAKIKEGIGTGPDKRALQALNQANRAIVMQMRSLRDLKAQGRATTEEYRKLADVMDRVAKHPNMPAKVRARIKPLADDIRKRAAENPHTISTVQPLDNMHIENAELMDAAATRHKVMQHMIANQEKANQLLRQKNRERLNAEKAQMAELEKIYRQQEAAVKQVAAMFKGGKLTHVNGQPTQQHKESTLFPQTAKAKASIANYKALLEEKSAADQAYVNLWGNLLDKRDQMIAREAQQEEKRQQAAMKSLASMFRNVKSMELIEKRGGLMGALFGDKKSTIGGGSGGGSGGGRGGRRSGGGHGGFDEGGKERGQMMPLRSKGAAKALLGLSSAAQGAMLGIAALDGNIVGLGFSLVFLGYGVVSVALAFAALTVALGAASRFFSKVLRESARAGAAMEKLGQQMTSYFKDQARAQANLTKASGMSRTFGIDPDSARQAVFALDKMGMATKTYLDAVANAAAGTNQDVTEVTDRWTEIQKASASERAGLMEKFAQEYDIANKKYTSSLELATALNERWGGAAAAAAATQIGLINRIKATWVDFTTTVGSVLEGFFKPALEAALAFTEALIAGFEEARDAGIASGSLQKNMEEFKATMIKITPYLASFGYVIGKVIYSAVVIAARVIKALVNAIMWMWNKIKPVVDTIRNWIQRIKELISWLVAWYRENRNLVNTIAAVVLGLAAFEVGTRILMGTLSSFIGVIQGVLGFLGALGHWFANTNLAKVIKLGVSGADAVLKAIGDIAKALAGLGDKLINVGTNLWGDALSGLQKVGDKLDEIARKAANIRLGGVGDGGGTGGTGGVGSNIKLPSFVPTFPVDTIAGVMASAIRLAAAHPLVTAAIAAAALVIAVGIFPKESGITAKEVADWGATIALLIAGTFVRMELRLIGAFVKLTATIISEGINIIATFAEGMYNAFKNLFTSVLDGIRDIIVGVITGDWERAARGALEIFKAVFLSFPQDIFGAFFNTILYIMTEAIPRIGETLVTGFLAVLEPLREVLTAPFTAAWDFIENRAELFKAGWVSRKMDTMRAAFWDQLKKIKADFFSIFDFTGAESIGKIITGAFDAIGDILSRMSNPFEKILGWLDPIIDKAKDAAHFLDAILPGKQGGGGSSSSSSSSSSASQARTWVPAIITQADLLSLRSGGRNSYYTIARSHWSNEAVSYTEVMTEGLTYPDLSKYALGGRVPGRPGTKVPVLADAGEVFLGHPSLARGSGREQAAVGGSGSVDVYIDMRESVVTNDVVDKIAGSVASALVGQLAGNRRMSFHRMG